MAEMSLSVEQSASMGALIQSIENLLERTLKLNKRILEGFEKEAKQFFADFRYDIASLIQIVNVVSQSMENLMEGSLKSNKSIMQEFARETKQSLKDFLDNIDSLVPIVNMVRLYSYEKGVDKVVAEVNQIKNIQQRMLAVLMQLEISCRTLTSTAGSIAEGIRLLSSKKEEAGGNFEEFATPILQDVIAAMLVEALKDKGIKVLGKDINLGRIVLGISLALATFELADSDDVISRLIGAPITAFLAGYTYTGSITISLIIGGVVLAVNGLTEVSKFLGDEITKYINKKWDLNLPSLEELGMKDWSFFDFVKFGLSPEGLKHPFATGELITLALFGPDFSWEKFWEEEQQKLISALFGVFGLSSPITQNSEEFGAGMMLGIINGFEAEIEEFRQMIEDWIENDVKSLFNKDKWIKILDGIPNAFLETFQIAFSGVASIIGGFVGLGEDAANGFIDGVTKQKSKLASEIEKFANIPINVVRATLDEHSPSKVMFQLGNFAMQGFKNGIESLYSPTLKSIETFGKELQFVPAINNIPNDKSIYTESLRSNSTYGYSNNSFLKYIEQSLHSDMKRVLSESLQNKTNSPEIRVFIGDREITDVAIEGINRRTIRNQKSPLI
ncbi:MAG: hypothetical protein J1E83_14310 [Lachnospiraceae bacterium]|nr:hypothetical protein [Lachnospiraceae bacterium]